MGTSLIGRRYSKRPELWEGNMWAWRENLGGFIVEVEADSVEEAEGPGAHSWPSLVPLFAGL